MSSEKIKQGGIISGSSQWADQVNRGERTVQGEALRQVLNACKETGATLTSFTFEELKRTML